MLSEICICLSDKECAVLNQSAAIKSQVMQRISWAPISNLDTGGFSCISLLVMRSCMHSSVRSLNLSHGLRDKAVGAVRTLLA